MKNLIYVLFLSLILIACSKSDANVENCDRISGKKTLSEKDIESICEYLLVYRYNDNIYTTCECCVCNKINMAFDCDGNQLCDWEEDCMIDFDNMAELIGYVEF